MASWSGKSRGGSLGYRFFILILKHTHIQVAYFFARFVALYFLVFSDKKSQKFYFREILKCGKFKTWLNIYRNYIYLGQVILDKMAILSGNLKRFTFELEGKEHLQKMIDDRTGGLLIGAHMGNWEMAGQLLNQFEVKINILMLDQEHQKIKELLDKSLEYRRVNIIPIKDDFSHLFKITEAFKNKEIVAMHGDRFLPGTNTVTVNFMGKPAQFPAGPVYLASKNKVPVSFVFTMKDSATHYHFHGTAGKVFPYPSKLKTRKIEINKMVGEYVQALENKLKQYPLQWFNYHPFWDDEKN